MPQSVMSKTPAWLKASHDIHLMRWDICVSVRSLYKKFIDRNKSKALSGLLLLCEKTTGIFLVEPCNFSSLCFVFLARFLPILNIGI